MLGGAIVTSLRECALLIASAAAALYLQLLHSRLPPGAPRLLAAAPLFALFGLAPLLYDPVSEPIQVMLAINYPWLTNSTVLGWALGRGPLARGLPFRAAFAFLLAPSLPATSPALAYRPSLLRATFKLVLLAAATYTFQCTSIPSGLLYGALQSVTLYVFTSLAYEGAAIVAQQLGGMPVMDPFDRPFLSTSLRDFWAWRWNITTGAKFRHALYEPICEGLLVCPGGSAAPPGGTGRLQASTRRRAAAVCITFAASGASHELAFFYLTRRLSGRWMLFFTLQGPLLLAESWLRMACRQAGIRVPRAARRAATLALLHTMALHLFYHDMTEHGLPSSMLRQLAPRQADICPHGGRS